jgi:hypothetical protein
MNSMRMWRAEIFFGDGFALAAADGVGAELASPVCAVVSVAGALGAGVSPGALGAWAGGAVEAVLDAAAAGAGFEGAAVVEVVAAAGFGASAVLPPHAARARDASAKERTACFITSSHRPVRFRT